MKELHIIEAADRYFDKLMNAIDVASKTKSCYQRHTQVLDLRDLFVEMYDEAYEAGRNSATKTLDSPNKSPIN